jgi:hypothetical protein
LAKKLIVEGRLTLQAENQLAKVTDRDGAPLKYGILPN